MSVYNLVFSRKVLFEKYNSCLDVCPNCLSEINIKYEVYSLEDEQLNQQEGDLLFKTASCICGFNYEDSVSIS